MDNKKWEALRGSAGFYITLAVCLLVVAGCCCLTGERSRPWWRRTLYRRCPLPRRR